MVTEEDVVALVVEGDHASSRELWVVREQACKHSSHRVSQSGVEVVQHDLGAMCGGFASALKR